MRVNGRLNADGGPFIHVGNSGSLTTVGNRGKYIYMQVEAPSEECSVPFRDVLCGVRVSVGKVSKVGISRHFPLCDALGAQGGDFVAASAPCPSGSVQLCFVDRLELAGV